MWSVIYVHGIKRDKTNKSLWISLQTQHKDHKAKSLDSLY